MGAWGPGIFDDDVASDIRAMFESDVQKGQGVAAATDHILNAFSWALEDEEDAALTYTALAALQLEHGTLDQVLYDKAIGYINSGVLLWRWEGMASNKIEARKAAIDDFRVRLMRYVADAGKDDLTS